DDMLELAGEHFPVLRRLVASAGHVLPDQHAKTIRMVVPTRRFDFHVLANQVETEPLCGFDVGGKRFISWRRVEPVRPPALIEQPVFKKRLPVEEQTIHASRIALDRDRPDAGVALNFIASELDLEVIEKRLIGRPQLGLWNTHNNRPSGGTG